MLNIENRSYLMFNVSEISNIDFSEVLEDSVDTLRKSIDGTKTFVKYLDSMPTSVSSLTTKEGPYNHSEFLSILSTSSWTPNNLG